MEKKFRLRFSKYIILFAIGLAACPAVAHAATLYISPSSGSHAVGAAFSVSVYISSSDQAINAASGVVSFPADKLEVVSISKSGSIFTLWVQEPSFSNTAGTVNFEGIVLNPGFTGSNGKAITIAFRIKSAGAAALNFSSGSVLANDGQGTNVLSALNGGAYSLKISSAAPQVSQTISETESLAVSRKTASLFFIKSKTHPDQGKWYSNNDPIFEWTLPEEADEVRLVLSRKETSLPTVIYSPPISEKKLENLDDGVWYLHARFAAGSVLSPVSAFKFQIDTEKPEDFDISRLDNDNPTNPRPELSFESNDEISGIDRYEMKIGEGDWFKLDDTGPRYKLPLQFPGKRDVVVRAYDKAGNYSEDEYPLEVVSIETPAVFEISNQPLSKGQAFSINGSSEPLRKIKIFFVSEENSHVVELETAADENGRWSFVYDDDVLSDMKHGVHVYAIDERGAVSHVSNSIRIIFKGNLGFTLFDLSMRGFDSLISFIINGWLLMIELIFLIGLVYWTATSAMPYIAKETKRFIHIAKEYKLSKNVRKKTKKMQFEIREFYEDVKKELSLLEKIEKHRGLHPDEKYLKEKLEKYLRLLKSFK